MKDKIMKLLATYAKEHPVVTLDIVILASQIEKLFKDNKQEKLKEGK